MHQWLCNAKPNPKYMKKVEPSFPYLPCKAWTPRNTDKGVNSTWLYFVNARIQHQEERLSFILILRL